MCVHIHTHTTHHKHTHTHTVVGAVSARVDGRAHIGAELVQLDRKPFLGAKQCADKILRYALVSKETYTRSKRGLQFLGVPELRRARGSGYLITNSPKSVPKP